MAKITLGKRPKNFKHTVKVKMLDGTEGEVPVVYTYRTRSEYGAMLDKRLAASGITQPATPADADAPPATAAAQATLQAMFEQGTKAKADYLMQILEGWELDIPFTEEAVHQLCDELPGAAEAISDAYRDAISVGRLGN